MNNIKYKKLSKKFSAQKLKYFFDDNMPGKTLKQCQSVIKNSSVIVGAYDKSKLIGINRSVDDGVYAFLTDLIVQSEYRHQGIGTKLTRILCQEIKKRKIKVIHCSTSKKLIPLFKKLGFKYDSQDITMFLKN